MTRLPKIKIILFFIAGFLSGLLAAPYFSHVVYALDYIVGKDTATGDFIIKDKATGSIKLRMDSSGYVTVATMNASNISSGEFGYNTGGGNFSFPGNLGIGTTSPGQKLDVSGNIGLTGNIRAQNGTVITHLPWTNFGEPAGEPDGYIKLSTPIIHNESNMFSIKIEGYEYAMENNPISIQCVGYAYSGSTLIATKCNTEGTNLPVEIGTETRSDQGGNNVVVIRIGTPTTDWYYPHLTAEYRGWQAKNPADFKWVTSETTPAQTGNTNNVIIRDQTGSITAPILYDFNDSSYYLDPNSVSYLNDIRPNIIYDRNDTAYYVDPNGSSRFNYMGRNYGFNWTEYDWNDTGYYVDPNNTSLFNDLRANIFYDRQDTGYYVDPASTSRQNRINFTSMYGVNWAPGEPRWDFSAYVVESQHFYGHDSTQTMYLGESNPVLVRGDIRSPIFYDYNDTGYYVDPNGNNRMSSLYVNNNLINWPGYATGLAQAPGAYIYPGRADGGSWQTSWYLASHGSYGLYSNTGLYAAGHIWSGGYMLVGQYLNVGLWTGDSPGTQVCRRSYDNYMGVCTSLREYKENISDLKLGLDTIMQLQPRTFDWKQPAGSATKYHDLGFIAEEVEAVNPLLTGYDKGQLISVKYDKLTAVLTNAIKEQQKQIEELQEKDKKIDELSAKIEDLQKQIDALKK